MIKKIKMRGAKNVVLMEGKGNSYGVFAGKFEGKRQTDIRLERITTHAIQNVAKRTHLGKIVMNVMSLRYGYSLDELNKCWLIKRNFRCVELGTSHLPCHKKIFSPYSHALWVAVQEN
jgi:hypothetical protein